MPLMKSGVRPKCSIVSEADERRCKSKAEAEVIVE